MATILKVHGTFASGPEEGDKWWQRGSECCNHVGELVEAEDGNLKIEQVIWDGLNSERSRQAAAAKLLDRMSELEKAGEPYCVVGHSHGGSVISAALLRAAFYKKPLEKLSRWITIGTPFIEAQRSRLMFARLGPVGKTLFLTFWTMMAASAYATYRSVNYLSGKTDLGEEFTRLFKGMSLTNVVIPSLILALVASYPILWLLARRRLPWHDTKTRAAARQRFATRWLSLRHEDDEAIQGLAAFETFRKPIFPRNFAVQPLSKVAILAVPLLIFWMISVSSDVFVYRLTESNAVKLQQAAQEKLLARPSAPQAPTDAAEKAGANHKDALIGDAVDAVLLTFFILLLPALLYGLIVLLSRPTSVLLSFGLNGLTRAQLRAQSLGDDIDGEIARFARSRPAWLDEPQTALPQDLASEIATLSDTAAAMSLVKFRAALSDTKLLQLQHDGRDALNAFLTGDELIHTTYFKVPRFRKLLAYSIAKSPGFRPSPALLADPDFPLIEQWYKELMAPSDPVASQNQPASLGAAAVMPT